MMRLPGRQMVATAAAIGLLYALSAIASLAFPAESTLKKATLVPLWSPQAQFAGYYVALDKGIYARHGIDMRILRAGPGHSPARTLETGEADFAVLWMTTALEHRFAGAKLVNLAQVVQRSSMMLVARKSSGIRSIADMNGRRVGLWGGDLSIPHRILFAKSGISVVEVPQSHTVNLFLRGGIDVASAMWFNEYHTILNSGLDADELSVFFLHDQGMNFPEDGLYALESTVTRDPALVEAFTHASLEGWRYAFAHPEEALDIVLKYMLEAHVTANRVHQRWMLQRMRDLVLTGEAGQEFGILKQRDYQDVANALVQAGMLAAPVDYRSFARSADAGP